uniref:acylglycerol lipase n=1 Tax=Denticeps clupeoides TaxID=299321 RepID=A0AAY4BYH6_9TELE
MDLDVVNMFVIAGGTLAIPILAFVASFLLWPAALIKVYYWYWRRRLGIKPSFLMLHGFSAHKDMWLSVVKFLPKNVHVVCVDMPGHEGTSRTGAADYAIEGQVKRIRQFVESIHLDKKPFHLVGTSMGGNVAGVYAARYPRDLCSVTLVCPAGLNNPTHSKFVKLLQGLEKSKDSHSIPLIPSTPEEMEEMLKLCSFVRFKIPQQILRGLVDVRIPHNDFYREVFLEIVGENSRHSLHDNMHLISAPLQVIWGKQDQVLDVSGASLVAAAVPGCQVDLLDNCGHSVVMERPRKTAQLMMDFITAQQNAGSASNKKLS